jgi:hypothetical protein
MRSENDAKYVTVASLRRSSSEEPSEAYRNGKKRHKIDDRRTGRPGQFPARIGQSLDGWGKSLEFGKMPGENDAWISEQRHVAHQLVDRVRLRGVERVGMVANVLGAVEHADWPKNRMGEWVIGYQGKKKKIDWENFCNH